MNRPPNTIALLGGRAAATTTSAALLDRLIQANSLLAARLNRVNEELNGNGRCMGLLRSAGRLAEAINATP